VLVLDEPTVGLDPKQIIAIRELIRELGRDRTLLLSTHILPEVEQLCQRVLIIDRGRIIADGTPAELRHQARGNPLLDVTVKDAPPEAAEALSQIPGVVGLRPDEAGGGRFRIECGAGDDLREAVFRTAVDKGWVLLELSEKKASLEDIFIRLTAEAFAADDTESPEGLPPPEAPSAEAPSETESGEAAS
jgi:ABC-2 type transport system ATP-binding protein